MQANFTISRVLLATLPLILIVAGPAAAAELVPTVKDKAVAFFKRNCYDCHDAATAKAGLNLEKVDPTMGSPDQIDLWTRIHDRLARGEMPPAKKQRPAPAEIEAFLGAIRPTLFEADRARRHVVQRRLNRDEYQNTVWDLLGIDVELKGLLPADQQAGGFDNNGEALAVSTEQLQAYVEAARLAINAALLVGERPQTTTVKISGLDEVKRYVDTGEFGYQDGRIILYTTDKGDYSKISTRPHRAPVRGRYRFRFDAVAHGTDDLQFFTVTASDFAAVGATSKNLGYFDVGPKPKSFEIEALMEPKSAIQFFAFGLPGWIRAMPGVDHPGIGFGDVEMTGPIIDQWPPERFTRLMGDVSLEKGTLADAKEILRRFMPRAFRRPVTAEELDRYTGLIGKRMEAGRDFNESLRAGLVAVLCSPNFLYLREDVRPQTRRVADTQLASRLSYFFWRTMPDDELLELAAKGQLSDPKTLHAQVERMLKHRKAAALVSDFTGQWLRLRQINDTTPDERLYRKFDDLLRVSMVWEGEGFFHQLLVDDLPIVNLLDSDWAMLNQRLAEHYGIEGVKGVELRKVSLPPNSVRGGVLTQAGVLKVTANGTTTSPVLRGVWVLENILGQPTPPPPPNVGGIEPDIRGATTIREQLDKHRHVESCAVCHSKIDPPGFALESFDPIGDYREKYLRWHATDVEKGWGNVEQGAKVDSSGKLASGQRFEDILQFKKLLVERQDDFARRLTEKLLTFGLGREMGFSDRDAVAAMIKQADSHGRGLRSLIHAIAESETFATR
jgi:mono/diheme cytochrome c family protein